MEKNKCWDCGRELTEGDEVMVYETPSGGFFKCRECHEKDPVLRNFQECIVYSRIVGYYSPHKNWNAGKSEELKDRKMFKLKKEDKIQ